MNTPQDGKPTLQLNYKIFAVIFALLFISLIAGIVFSMMSLGVANKKIDATAEAKRPANIEAVVIRDSECKDCADPALFMGALEKQNVKFTGKRDVERDSEEGRTLISRYTLARLPAIVLTGEIGKGNDLKIFLSQAGESKDGAIVIRALGAPYVDLASGQVKGRTSLTLLVDRTCSECYDVNQHETILQRGYGLNPASRLVEVQSAEGRSLIRKYAIKYVPTFVLAGDVNEFAAFKSVWPQVGTVERDGAYVFRTMSQLGDAVYRDLRTNRVIRPFANQASSTQR